MRAIREITMFRSFRNRNYSIFFVGQSVSQIGTWMQKTAISWVVYSQTQSTFMLGLTVFASLFPSFLFSIFGGVVSDRFDRYKILLITQIASLLQSLILTIFVFSGHYSITGIIILTTILGTINAFDVPARQPLVNQLVKDKSELPNALALNSSMVNLARLLGPALSGLTLQALGAGVCFLINTISFLAVIISLLCLKLPPYEPNTEKKKVVEELKDGFKYIKDTKSIGVIMLVLTLLSLLVTPYDTLIPVFAKETFHGDARTFGLISSFVGIGAFISTMFLASLKPQTDLKNILLINTVIMGIGLICFSQFTVFSVAMLFAMLVGFGGTSQTTICLTLIQIHSAPNMRGRVISFLAMSVFGMLPIGSLLLGSLSHKIGPSWSILIQGVIAIAIAAIFSNFLRSDKIKKKDLGLIPESESEIVETI